MSVIKVYNYTGTCASATLSGIDARCDVSFGGIKRILIGNRDLFDIGFSDVHYEVPGTLVKMITKIEPKPEYTTQSPKFVQFLFRRGTGSYTSTVAPDIAIGNSFATTEVTLQFSRAEAGKRLAIQSLINTGDACVIIEDMYGKYLFLGLDQNVIVTNAVMQSGTAQTDLSGFTLTLQDVSLELPFFINAAANEATDLYVDINSLTAPIEPPLTESGIQDPDMTT